MSKKYFDYFPRVDYDIHGDGETSNIVDITKRFKVRDVLKAKAALFDTYYVHNGERPDVVSSRLYGRSDLDWLLFACNDLLDPFFDWPMSHWDLQDHIKARYGSLSAARNLTKYYQKIVQAETMTPDGTRIPEQVIYVDSEEYTATPLANRRLITVLDWETEQNELRKTIKILDKRYLSQVLLELEKIFGNT